MSCGFAPCPLITGHRGCIEPEPSAPAARIYPIAGCLRRGPDVTIGGVRGAISAASIEIAVVIQQVAVLQWVADAILATVASLDCQPVELPRREIVDQEIGQRSR